MPDFTPFLPDCDRRYNEGLEAPGLASRVGTLS